MGKLIRWLTLGWYKCMIALPKFHHLSKKAKLTWSDLSGESLLLVKEGISNILDQIRSDIRQNHPDVLIQDYDNLYDINTFNKCLSDNLLMECPEFWSDIHPSIITLPMEWDYQCPYGVLYSKTPSEGVQKFIEVLQKSDGAL